MADTDTIRSAAVAGTFYPDEPEELREMVNGFIEKATAIEIPGKLKGFVIPHAGYNYSGPVAGFAYKLLSKFSKDVKRVVMLGPSHYGNFRGVAESGMGYWETPLGRVRVKSMIEETGDKKTISVFAEAHLPEHCLEVQLPFLQMTLGEKFDLYTAITGDVEPKTVADVLSKMDNKETIFIASSDLSHYNTYEKAKEIDAKANRYIPEVDVNNAEKYLDACGRTGILSLMYLAKSKGWKGKILDYRNSGDTAGDKIRVVGYGAYAFYEEK